jgi:magnesium-protoporphyrin O-methyltransferase
MTCCYGEEYDEVFGAQEAERTAARFRRLGLRGTAAELASVVQRVVGKGNSVLEVGGGAGQIQIALLTAGVVERAINVELSDNWEDAGKSLLVEHDLEDRVERRVGNFVDLASGLENADAVILHRVICCYPDWKAMLAAAASRANHVVGITIPSSRWWLKMAVVSSNMLMRLRRLRFRAFVHPPDAMLTSMESAGFTPVYDRSHPLWRTIVWSRNDPRLSAS